MVFIGRYANSKNNLSESGAALSSLSITVSRENAQSLGTMYWQIDYPIMLTIWLLYLVEFADWNSQNCIGYGCSRANYSVSFPNTGYTDSMPYHTGTTKSSREEYGTGIQYRNIEGLWDTKACWVDGLFYDYNNSLGLYIQINPNKYANYSYSESTNIGTLTNGYPTKMRIVNTGTMFILVPQQTDGNAETYISDSMHWYGTNYIGNSNQYTYPYWGYGGQTYNNSTGMFHIGVTNWGGGSGSPQTRVESSVGYRLQELP